MLDAMNKVIWFFGVDTMMMRTSNEQVRQSLKSLYELEVKNIVVNNPNKAMTHTHFEGEKLVLGGPLKGYFAVIGETIYFGPTIDVKDAINMAFSMSYRHCGDDNERCHQLVSSAIYVGSYEVKDELAAISNQEKHSIHQVLMATDGYGKSTRYVTTKKEKSVKEAFFSEKALKNIVKHAKQQINSYEDYYRLTNQ